MRTNKKSSVEWLVEELRKFYEEPWKYDKQIIIEQAKSMHKEETISYGKDFAKQMLENKRFVNAEMVYNETFGGNNEQR